MPRQIGTQVQQGSGGGGGIFKLLASAIQPFVPAPIGAAAGFLAGNTGAGGVASSVAGMLGGEENSEDAEKDQNELTPPSTPQTQAAGPQGPAAPQGPMPVEQISPYAPPMQGAAPVAQGMTQGAQMGYTPEQLQQQDQVFQLAEAQFPWMPQMISANPGLADGVMGFAQAAKRRYGAPQG